eukprot:3233052-Heterocapsa_arctica.AAC.1
MIGEAANLGPGVNNKQLRQTKMGDFDGGAHHLRDEKVECCREKRLAIHRVRRHGNCRYTCLGKHKKIGRQPGQS